MKRQEVIRLYLITDRSVLKGKSLEAVVEDAVLGGVTMVQLREKECSGQEFYVLAKRLKRCLDTYNIPLIINDRVDIAMACDAAGVHVGQADLPVSEVRNLLGPQKIIGLSVECLADAYVSNTLPVDYIGVSPVFYTSTKKDIAAPLGIEGIKAIKKISKHPLVGIGGITHENVCEVIRAGGDGIAVVSALLAAEDPRKSAEKFKLSIQLAINSK